MKRFLSLILVVLMLFSACFLFSCDKDEEESERESSSSKKGQSEKETSSSSKKDDDEVVTAKSIKLDTDKLTLKVGETYVFTVGFTPENTTDKSLTFSSSSEHVARVTNKGVVMGYNPGEATIMVSSNGRVDWCTVTVVK